MIHSTATFTKDHSVFTASEHAALTRHTRFGSRLEDIHAKLTDMGYSVPHIEEQGGLVHAIASNDTARVSLSVVLETGTIQSFSLSYK